MASSYEVAATCYLNLAAAVLVWIFVALTFFSISTEYQSYCRLPSGYGLVRKIRKRTIFFIYISPLGRLEEQIH
jgi:hypothetical protein